MKYIISIGIKENVSVKIDGLHEKEIFEKNCPFRMIVNNDIDFIYPPHWHSAVEILYVVKNDFKAFINSKEIYLNESDILYIPGGDIHEFRATTQTGTRIFINFEISNLSSYSFMESVKRLCSGYRVIKPEDGELYNSMKTQLEKILEEHNKEDVTSQLYYIARVIDMIVLLCKTMPAHINAENIVNSKKKIVGLEKINKSFEYIEKNYSEDIKLADIAKFVGFSEYYFSRLFKEVTEKSFHQYLNEYRIRKAVSLLDNAEYSISEAAYAAGFSSIATFDRLFRQIKGCTPQKYRKLRSK